LSDSISNYHSARPKHGHTHTHTYIQIVFLFFVNVPVQCFSLQVVLISRKAKMDQTDKAKPTLCAFTEAEEENNNKVRETEKKKKNLFLLF